MREPWIRVHARLRDKPVVIRLAAALKIDQHKAMGHLVDFWGGVSLHAKEGLVGDEEDAVLERWAGWTGKRGAFAAWIRENHLDEEGRVNAWMEYAGALEVRRAKERDRIAQRRADLAQQLANRPPVVAQQNADSTQSVAQQNANVRDVLQPARAVRNANDNEKDQEQEPKGAAKATPWMAWVRKDWRERYQADPPPAAPKILRPLINEHGELVVRPRLREYLRVTEARFVDLHRFKATFGDWAPRQPQSASGGAVKDAATAFAELGV